MLHKPYAVKAHAKFILTGEHAVLEGAPALVFPLKNKVFSIDYTPAEKRILKVDGGFLGESILTLFWHVLLDAAEKLQQGLSQLTGRFSIANHIPMGAGLGFSAAISTAVTRLLINLGFVQEKDLFAFSKRLENFFHGKSSGVDIMGVLSDVPQSYRMETGGTPLALGFQPHVYLSYCKKKSITKKSIRRVTEYWKQDPLLAQAMQDQMTDSALLAEKALAMTNLGEGTRALQEAIAMAEDCFRTWGLISRPVEQHMNTLKEHGALACKPTGSGDGGYILSLWAAPPPEEALPFPMLSGF